MNVNYVSRCFVNETHQKFSAYLMNLRVQKAKEILSGQNPDKIQNVAELVGCGIIRIIFLRFLRNALV